MWGHFKVFDAHSIEHILLFKYSCKLKYKLIFYNVLLTTREWAEYFWNVLLLDFYYQFLGDTKCNVATIEIYVLWST